MSESRYQLWLRLLWFHPGTQPTEGRATFGWRVLDTQHAEHAIHREEARLYGFILTGSSDEWGCIETMLQNGVPNTQKKQQNGSFFEKPPATGGTGRALLIA